MMNEKKLIQTIKGRKFDVPPLWLMRQAGRYLPEYRALRKESSDFMSLCFSPNNAAEVTLQPAERFNIDALILFSDILVIPHALGQKVTFVEEVGPCLQNILDDKNLSALDSSQFDKILSPVYETIDIVKKRQKNHLTFIGFSGAPWTLATYMIEGKGSKDFAKTKYVAYHDDVFFSDLIDLLCTYVAQYLCKQIRHGVDVVKIFDSWSGALPDDLFMKYCALPIAKIVKIIRAEFPDIPIIAFPKGARRLEDFVDETKIDVLAIDSQVPLQWARKKLQPKCVIQGNLDPALLRTGGQKLTHQIHNILRELNEYPFIFNLGHGVQKETDPKNVQQLIDDIHNFSTLTA